MALKALCMKCREKDENGKSKPTMQDMTNIKVETKTNEKTGSVRYSAKGTCGNCSGNMFKFMSADDAQAHM